MSATANATARSSGAGGGGGSGSRHLEVDKKVINELLLVCGVIGSNEKQGDDAGHGGEERLVPVTDCLLWLQDLQRALRRDDDAHRPIALLLGSWKIVQTKLLPLARSAHYDGAVVLTVLKILVILTKPLTEQARRAARMVIDVKSGKVPYSVIQEQIKLRQNAISQSDTIMEYKRAIVQEHTSSSSSTKSRKRRTGRGGGGGQSSSDAARPPTLLSTVVSLLAEPLSKKRKSDADHLVIELVLHLVRNLLCAEPVLKVSMGREGRESADRVHDELVSLFHEEMVLEVVLVLGQGADDARYDQYSGDGGGQYNLLLMEIVRHLLRDRDPVLVARFGSGDDGELGPRRDHGGGGGGKERSTHGRGPSKNRQVSSASGSTSLRAVLGRERSRLSSTSASTSRHSHFGGTLVVRGDDGSRQVLSSVLQAAGGGGAGAGADEPVRKKNKKTSAFASDGRRGGGGGGAAASSASSTVASPAARRAHRALHGFCTEFLTRCYGPLMKSLKNEFRRDSARLEDGDRTVFFRIVWFFSKWQRVAGGGRDGAAGAVKNNADTGSSSVVPPVGPAVGHLVFTMDLFTFKLVLQACDTYAQHKRHHDLAQAVALYSEMMHLLVAMGNSSDETEGDMSIGLRYQLFYAEEPLDRLPKLFREWQSGTYSREYLCDLVDLAHATLKLLDRDNVADADSSSGKSRTKPGGKSRKTKKKGGADDEQEARDRVAQMKLAAEEFDVTSYFGKLVSNHVVHMYTQLLGRYDTNAPHVNHHIVAFFLRMCKFVVSRPDDDDDEDGDGDEDVNLLRGKIATLEPMLYEINLFLVLNKILNDSSIRGNRQYSSVIQFAKTIVRHFALAAERNPLLFVECMFRHPIPHRFCELSTNMYVTEELRMMAMRDLLRGAHENDDSVGVVGGEDEGMTPNGNRGDPPTGTGGVDGGESSEGEWVDESNDREQSSVSLRADKNVRKQITSDGQDGPTSSIQDEEKNNLHPTTEKSAEEEDGGSDDDDERWNDRRAFVPKRRRITRRVVDADDEESISPTSVSAVGTSQKVGKKSVVGSQESDDDEHEFETSNDKLTGTESSRLVFDGDGCAND